MNNQESVLGPSSLSLSPKSIAKRPLVAIVVTILVLGAGFWYWSQREKGAVGAAKNVSEAVPEIQTNLGQNVPEVNPLDLANPFKYKNPLR